MYNYWLDLQVFMQSHRFSCLNCLKKILHVHLSQSISCYDTLTFKVSAVTVCVCVYSNSRNDVPRVAQRYGTIAAHTRRRASVLAVFVVFACTFTVLPV